MMSIHFYIRVPLPSSSQVSRIDDRSRMYEETKLGDLDAGAEDGDSHILRTAVDKLDKCDREPLLQQIRCQRSISDISLHLRLPEREVRERLARARRQLRLLCGEDLSFDPLPSCP